MSIDNAIASVAGKHLRPAIACLRIRVSGRQMFFGSGRILNVTACFGVTIPIAVSLRSR